MKTIGFIGKTTITPEDREALKEIGRLVALIGHQTVMVNGKGTIAAVKEGFELEGGTPQLIDKGVIEAADHTMVFGDTRLIGRLRQAYPDIDDRKDVTIIKTEELQTWLEAVESVYQDKQTTK